jgi:hypothetical protein
MVNYYPISTKFDTHTKKSTLRSKIIKAEAHGHFQDGRSGFLGNSSAC